MNELNDSAESPYDLAKELLFQLEHHFPITNPHWRTVAINLCKEMMKNEFSHERKK